MIRIAEIVLALIAIFYLTASAFGSVATNWHRWRGLQVDRQLFMVFISIGFLTIGFSRHLIQDELKALRQALKRFRGGRE